MSYRRTFENALRHRDSILEDVKVLTESVLLDVVDCEMRVADALSRVGESVGSSSGDVSRPTERAALRLAGAEERTRLDGTVVPAEPDTWEEFEADPVGDAVNEFLADLAEAAGHLRRAARRIPVITDAGARLRGHKNSIDQCLCCDRDVLGTRDDRMKAGLCSACYEAWRRTGFTDRFTFMRGRRAQLKRTKAVGNGKVAGR